MVAVERENLIIVKAQHQTNQTRDDKVSVIPFYIPQHTPSFHTTGKMGGLYRRAYALSYFCTIETNLM